MVIESKNEEIALLKVDIKTLKALASPQKSKDLTSKLRKEIDARDQQLKVELKFISLAENRWKYSSNILLIN